MTGGSGGASLSAAELAALLRPMVERIRRGLRESNFEPEEIAQMEAEELLPRLASRFRGAGALPSAPSPEAILAAHTKAFDEFCDDNDNPLNLGEILIGAMLKAAYAVDGGAVDGRAGDPRCEVCAAPATHVVDTDRRHHVCGPHVAAVTPAGRAGDGVPTDTTRRLARSGSQDVVSATGGLGREASAAQDDAVREQDLSRSVGEPEEIIHSDERGRVVKSVVLGTPEREGPGVASDAVSAIPKDESGPASLVSESPTPLGSSSPMSLGAGRAGEGVPPMPKNAVLLHSPGRHITIGGVPGIATLEGGDWIAYPAGEPVGLRAPAPELPASQEYHHCDACERKTPHRLRYICTEHDRPLQSEINALEEYVEGDGDPGCEPLSVAVLLGFVTRLRDALAVRESPQEPKE